MFFKIKKNIIKKEKNSKMLFRRSITKIKAKNNLITKEDEVSVSENNQQN